MQRNTDNGLINYNSRGKENEWTREKNSLEKQHVRNLGKVTLNVVVYQFEWNHDWFAFLERWMHVNTESGMKFRKRATLDVGIDWNAVIFCNTNAEMQRIRPVFQSEN